MDAAELKTHLLEALKGYTGRKGNYKHAPVFDSLRNYYAVAKIHAEKVRKEGVELLILVRLVDDKLILEDTVDKTLAAVLLEKGVPREQMILVYEGETAPPPPIENTYSP